MVVTATQGAGGWNTQHRRPSEETCLIYEGDSKYGSAPSQPLREFVLLPRINMQLATFVTLTGTAIEGEEKFVVEIISNYYFIKSALRNATISSEKYSVIFFIPLAVKECQVLKVSYVFVSCVKPKK
jgi:hypothetical protein